VIALVLAALLSAGAPRGGPAAAPDPHAASTVEPRPGKAPARAEDPDAALLRELELLEQWELLENPELFGVD
jgi:hypothetical protein